MLTSPNELFQQVQKHINTHKYMCNNRPPFPLSVILTHAHTCNNSKSLPLGAENLSSPLKLLAGVGHGCNLNCIRLEPEPTVWSRRTAQDLRNTLRKTPLSSTAAPDLTLLALLFNKYLSQSANQAQAPTKVALFSMI